jgi:3,4-dihydroxy 2-butanone 4-phosphate synthase / GTP cyclohydrolase II
MQLAGWLKHSKCTRADFARAVGISPGRVTQICEGELPSLDLAERIAKVTGGAVTPNDFLGLVPSQQWIHSLMSDTQQRVTAAVEAFGRGEIVVVTDDDDRENEGDLVMAAVHATPEKMAFIIRNTAGIVCTPIPTDTAHRLRLAPMVTENDAPHGTAFTVSIDYKHGTTTGISAEDRTATVRNLANNNAGASDFVRPGHVFPLIAKDGGVLMRSGHTEAAVDLCRLANLEPVGVICELVNDDGTVMRGPQIRAFAEKHKLKQISVDELIAYRQAREKLVERVGEFTVETSIGTLKGYGYVTPFDKVHHMALVHGRIGDGSDVPTRLHRANVIQDMFGGAKSVNAALSRFRQIGRGVIVVLRDGTAGVPVQALPQDGESAAEAARTRQWREVGLGAQILKDLGVRSIRLLSSSQHTYVGLGGFGIEITATEGLEG